MTKMIESMESRVLLTASASVIVSDLAAGAAALSESKLDLKLALKGVALDTKAFAADVKGVKLTATQKAALKTLTKAVATDSAKVNGLITKILAAGTARGAQLEGTLKSLKAHPASSILQAKVAVALAKLQTVFSAAVITNVESVITADVITVDTDLAYVSAAIPSTQTTAVSTESSLSSDQITLTTDIATIESAINTLAADLA